MKRSAVSSLSQEAAKNRKRMATENLALSEENEGVRPLASSRDCNTSASTIRAEYDAVSPSRLAMLLGLINYASDSHSRTTIDQRSVPGLSPDFRFLHDDPLVLSSLVRQSLSTLPDGSHPQGPYGNYERMIFDSLAQRSLDGPSSPSWCRFTHQGSLPAWSAGLNSEFHTIQDMLRGQHVPFAHSVRPSFIANLTSSYPSSTTQRQDALANLISSLRPSFTTHDLYAAVVSVGEASLLQVAQPCGLSNHSVPQLLAVEAKNPALAPTDSSLASSHEEATPRTSSNDQTRVPVAIPSDPYVLSDYQCFLREHIVFVEADHTDVEVSARGRNVPIKLGQVGILCRHCAHLAQCNRPRGSVYFPAQLLRLYPAAQNMMGNHFAESCVNIPPEDKAKLLRLKEQNKKASRGSGMEYWARAAIVVGVHQTDYTGLIFSPVVTRRHNCASFDASFASLM